MVINLNKFLCSTKVVYRTVRREYVSTDFNCQRTFCDRLCSARARTIMAQSWPGISWPLIHSSHPIPRAVEVLHQHDNPLGMSGACLWTESHSAPKRKKVTNRVSDKLGAFHLVKISGISGSAAEWNTFRGFVPLENSQKKWKI